MKTQLEKEVEQISLKEKHASKDSGGSCTFTIDKNGVLDYDIENKKLYLQDKKELDKLQNQ